MAAQPHRRKKHLEPITLEELAADPSLSGMMSIFKVPVTGPPIPGYAPKTPTVPDLGSVPDSGAVPDSTNRLEVKLPIPAPVVETPTVPVSGTVVDFPTVPVSGTVPAGPPRVRIYRASLAQDGHSSGEQILLDTLWRLARPDAKESRLLTIGYDRLAAECRLNWKSVKAGLASLERKLALETIAPEDSNHRIGRTYRIFSYTEILNRRRRGGLVWVRKTRGVELFPSREMAITGTVPVSGTLPETASVPLSGTVPGTPSEAVPESRTAAVPETGTPLIGIDSNASRQTSSVSPALVQAILQHSPHVDDAAVQDLVDACHRRVSDATEEEIIHFIHLKAGSPGIRKPLGFLLTAVPRCFEGESFRQFRAEATRRREEHTRRQEQFQREAQAVLDDPASSEEERQWAREVLTS